MNEGSAAAASQAVPTVHLVEDDAMVAAALARLLRSHGYEVILHGHARAFLEAWRPGQPSCAVVDFVLPGMDGLALQGRLQELPEPPAVIFLSGLGDVAVCAAAMRSGAADFLTKPVDEDSLLAAIRTALEREARSHAQRAQRQAVQQRFNTLTPREQEVLEQVARGRLNKQIAHDLGISEKTVKVHRASAMAKVGTRSVAELVKLLERNAVLMPGAGARADLDVDVEPPRLSMPAPDHFPAREAAATSKA
jgi:RNA polymerase sigma factor (sigma-70 family)